VSLLALENKIDFDKIILLHKTDESLRNCKMLLLNVSLAMVKIIGISCGAKGLDKI